MRLCKPVLGSVLAFLPLCWKFAFAQHEVKVWKIGVLASSSRALNASREEALRAGLRDLGYRENGNVVFEYRYAEGRLERLPALARELVEAGVDVIVVGGTRVAVAARQATATVPIVAAGAGDLVRAGLVKSFTYPGGNVTGVSRRSPDFLGKRLEILKRAVPTIRRAAVLSNAANPAHERTFNEVELGARTLGMTAELVAVRGPGDFDRAFGAIARSADSLFLAADALFNSHIEALVGLAARHRVPAIYPRSDYVEAGGLMSYAVDLNDLARRSAWYIDQIFKGLRPGDLSMTEPIRFEWVIHLGTAAKLGLSMPPEAVARADRVVR
ncbi:MAG TPA: ABC transporter substrate-binding protein [candidate division Zixibacteria bacterium]|nr:ABC transporter substrate-binding protein [candidate division Zixibacteria bacterium]